MARLAGQIELGVGPNLDGFWEKVRTDLQKGKALKIEITVAPKLAEATAEMDAWRKKQSDDLKVGVDADTKKATAKLDVWRKLQSRSLDIGVNVDTTSLANATRLLTNFRTAALALSVITLPDLTQLAQGAIGLPAAFSGLVSVLATVKVGMDGVTNAFKAHEQATKTNSQATLEYTRSARELERAQRNVVQALKDANRAIEDQKDKLTQGQLSVEQASINVQRANERLAQGGFRSMSDYRQAIEDVKQANFDLSVSVKQSNRDVQDYYDNTQKGATGSDKFQSALEALANATDKYTKSGNAARGMTEQFSFAMSELSPKARDFVNQILGLDSAWDKLKGTVQDNLLDGLGKNIANLADKLLPRLTTGMGAVATSLNSNFKQVFDALATPQNLDLISRVFNNVAQAVKDAGPGFVSLTNALVKLSGLGSDALPRVAQAFDSVAGRFEDFVNRASEDGRLNKWIDDGLKRLKSLGDSLLLIGSIASSITKAYEQATTGAADASELAHQGLKSIADYLASDQGQAKLVEIFQGLHQAIQDIKEVLPGVIQGFGQFLGLLGGPTLFLLKEVGTLLSGNTTSVRLLTDAFIAMKVVPPILGAIGTAVGKLETGFGSLRKAIGEQGATGALKVLGSGMLGLIGSIGGLALGAGLIFALDQLAQAHEKAGRWAEYQRQREKDLQDQLDQSTGAATEAGKTQALKQAQQFKVRGAQNQELTVNVPVEAGKLGINSEDLKAATDPTQLNAINQVEDQLYQKTLAAIRDGKDAQWNRLGQALTDAGVNDETYAKAIDGDPDAIAAFNRAAENLTANGTTAKPVTILGHTVLPSGTLAQPDLGTAQQNLINSGVTSGAVSNYQRSTLEGNRAGGEATKASTSAQQFNPAGAAMFLHYGLDPGSLRSQGDGTVGFTLNNVTADQLARLRDGDPNDPNSGGGFQTTLGQRNPDGTSRVTITLTPQQAHQFVQGFATGGEVFGGQQGTDTVPAMLSNGEFVLNKKAADYYGPHMLHGMNQMKFGKGVGHYDGGGPILPLPNISGHAAAPGGVNVSPWDYLTSTAGVLLHPAEADRQLSGPHSDTGRAEVRLPNKAPAYPGTTPGTTPFPGVSPLDLSPPKQLGIGALARAKGDFHGRDLSTVKRSPVTPPPLKPGAPGSAPSFKPPPGPDASGNVPLYWDPATGSATSTTPTSPTGPTKPVPGAPVFNTTPTPAGPVVTPSGPVIDRMKGFINSLVGTPYVSGGFSADGTDCSGLALMIANMAAGKDPLAGGRGGFFTGNEGEKLAALGFQPGKGGSGDVTIGWNGTHTAITLPDGSTVSSGEDGGVKWGGGGSNEAQFSSWAHLSVDPNNLPAGLGGKQPDWPRGAAPPPSAPPGSVAAGAPGIPGLTAPIQGPFGPVPFDGMSFLKTIGQAIVQLIAGFFGVDLSGIFGLINQGVGDVGANGQNGSASTDSPTDPGPDPKIGAQLRQQADAIRATDPATASELDQAASDYENRRAPKVPTLLGKGIPGLNLAVPQTGSLGLSQQSSPAQVAAAIVAEGRRRGYSQDDIQAILATAYGESKFVPTADGGIQPGKEGDQQHAIGVFQQKPGYWPGAADPNQNIDHFFDALDKTRGQPGSIYDHITSFQKGPDGSYYAAFAQNPMVLSALQGHARGGPIRHSLTHHATSKGGFHFPHAHHHAISNGPLKHLSTGGGVNGPGGPTDDMIPAMLSAGEFVMRAKAVDHYGAGTLAAMNDMKVPRANEGWLVQPPPGASKGPLPLPGPIQSNTPAQPPGTAQPPQANTPGQMGSASTGPGPLPPAPGQPGSGPQGSPHVGDAVGAAGSLFNPKGGSGYGQPGASASPDGKDPRSILGAPPASSEHLHPALKQGIEGAFDTAGSLAGTAASLFTGGGGGAASSLIAGGAKVAGQAASAIANIGASLLVGTLTPGTTGQGYGAPLLPMGANDKNHTVHSFQSVHNGDIYTNNLDDWKRSQDRHEAQRALPFLNRVY